MCEGGFDSTAKGVRQGCPLTPLPFVLEVDVLATCTMQFCAQRMLRGYQTMSYPDGIPLLQYVEHTMFNEGSVEEARNLSTLLDLFVDFSGLQINCSQSVFFGFSLPQEEKLQCLEALEHRKGVYLSSIWACLRRGARC